MTSKRLEARIRRDFPQATAEVLERLVSLRLALAEKQSRERIDAAIVLLADGSLSRLERAVAVAERDWRDVLVAAGLAHGDWTERLDQLLGPRS